MRYEREDINKAIEVIKAGGIILYPTDTVWGIGCDATNEEAVRKIYELKKRADSKSMLVLMENPGLIDRYVDQMPEVAWELIEVSDKPLTIIYPNAKNLAANLIPEEKTVGIRITSEKFTSDLIRRMRKPLVSTSANISGEPTPANFDEISDEIKSGVDYVVQYRQDDTEKKQSSSIILLGAGGQIEILRK
ncbi:threonylcarbamoyl-AMP synthase [Halosquirtibacter xylanolyticus]|uniref:L-threonylcarbamoyladenylate synthase n=1 Tax=Halosquirtibacter xylanolyticus TaxID=3374599 RepID=UPI003749F63F|nr:threonylcarbamoyl-AMP synthase [Prolixibacteraceae bacterium]